MATFTSLGIGSGLDLNGIVSKLVALERQPLRQLQQQAATLQNRISLYGQVASQLSAVVDAATRLSSPAAWSGLAVSSSNPQVVAAALGGTGTARTGTHQVQVNALASVQSLASVALDAQQGVGSGSLSIEMGRWNGSTFTPGGGTPITVNVAAPNNTPAAIVAAINAASGSDGDIVASTLSDANGTRVVIASRQTGAEQGFRISVTDATNSGLNRLAYPPVTTTSTITSQVPVFQDVVNPLTGAITQVLTGYTTQTQTVSTTQGMNRTREAADAQVSIDGVDLTSASNRFDDAIPGVTLLLSQVSASPVTVTVSADAEGQRDQVESFIEAYNTLARTLNTATAYNADSKTAGPLQADRTAVGLQQALRAVLRSVREGGTYTRLNDVGIEQTRDGTLRINAQRFDAALANGAELGALFNASGTAGVSDGIFVRMRRLAELAVRDDSGTVALRQDALQAAARRNGREQDRVNDRADRIQARLVAQYAALDQSLGSLNALGSYVNQQVSAWNAMSGNNRR